MNTMGNFSGKKRVAVLMSPGEVWCNGYGQMHFGYLITCHYMVQVSLAVSFQKTALLFIFSISSTMIPGYDLNGFDLCKCKARPIFWYPMCEEESTLTHIALKRIRERGFLNKSIPNKFMMHFVMFSVRNLEWILRGKLHRQRNLGVIIKSAIISTTLTEVMATKYPIFIDKCRMDHSATSLNRDPIWSEMIQFRLRGEI